jgi:hypothetical protein
VGQVENEGGVGKRDGLELEPARDDLTVKSVVSGTTNVV